MLRVENLTVYYGKASAIRNVSLTVNEGEIVAVVGPNGAGKSTLLKTISGVVHSVGGSVNAGDILFNGTSIKNVRTDQLVRFGISFIPASRHIFSTMTVLENLELGGYARTDKVGLRKDLDMVLTLFPKLRDRIKQRGGTLSTGEQQMLAIGRALMAKPKLLLADEPSLGLSPNFVDTIFEKFSEINESGTSILIVEQNALMALDICNRGYVFKIGSIDFEGTKEELLNNGHLKEVFLGGRPTEQLIYAAT